MPGRRAATGFKTFGYIELQKTFFATFSGGLKREGKAERIA